MRDALGDGRWWVVKQSRRDAAKALESALEIEDGADVQLLKQRVAQGVYTQAQAETIDDTINLVLRRVRNGTMSVRFATLVLTQLAEVVAEENTRKEEDDGQ